MVFRFAESFGVQSLKNCIYFDLADNFVEQSLHLWGRGTALTVKGVKIQYYKNLELDKMCLIGTLFYLGI